MSYFFRKNGDSSKIPIQRRWYYSPAQALLHRLYPDLPEYSLPDQYRDTINSDWLPLVDLVDSPDSFIIKVELPGVERQDVSLTIHNYELWIQGERRIEKDDSHKYYCCEGNYGTFLRKIKLPSYCSLNNIESELKNGILTIIFKKNSNEKNKNIEIK